MRELLRHRPARSSRASTTRADAARRVWLERLVEGERRRPARPATAQRLNPTALARAASAAARSRDSRALPVREARRLLRRRSSSTGRDARDRARRAGRDPRAGSRSSRKSASATWRSTAPRRRSPAARRSASAWPRSSARNLQGVCYVLDEPTIGLHPRDNRILLDALAQARRQGQHAGGGRARRGHDPPRRARASTSAPAPACAAAAWWRRARVADLIGAARVGHRPLPGARRCSTRCSRGAPVDARRRRRCELRGADAAQPARRRRRASRSARLVVVTGVSRLGQVARWRATCCTPTCSALVAPSAAAGRRRAGRGCGCDGIARLRAGRPRARGRPDADRQDAALLPGHLRRLLGRDPQALRRHAGGAACAATAPARFSLQHRRRPLPGLRGPGHAARSR
ncbi:MAG: hypothetical protein MZW92_22105 [Comamonadaceae bacterium]|nr:hypothetical protein [Comamonadaceae bacterium]